MSEIRVANLAEPTQEEINKSVIKRAEEVLNIIRCKDCKYFMYGNGCFLQAVDYSWEEQMYANDFCSRGERR